MSLVFREKLLSVSPDLEFLCHKLKSGRILSFGNYGARNGLPVVFLHGSPGSRFEASSHHELAKELNLRLVAPERAGMGHSDPAPDQDLIQSARNVLELTDHLEIQRFAVAAYSGGAGCLYGLRYLAPDRILCAADIAGFAPVGDYASLRKHLAPLDRLYFSLGKLLPVVFRLAFIPLVRVAQHPNSEKLVRFMRSSLSSADVTWLNDEVNRISLHADVSEGCRQGAYGPAHDALQLYASWGFTLNDTSSKLLIFASDQDRFAPAAFAAWKADRITNSNYRLFKGIGHLGIVERMPDILRALGKAARQELSSDSNASSKVNNSNTVSPITVLDN